MTPAEVYAKAVEAMARAICQSKGGDPDRCVMGFAGVANGKPPEIACYRRAWEDYHSSAADALAVGLATCREHGWEMKPVEATEEILEALDEDGERIFDGGTEHYFRNENEAFWYGRQVYHAMLAAAPAFGPEGG